MVEQPKGSCFDKACPEPAEGLGTNGNGNRHCEERSDEAIWEEIATLRSQ